MEIGVLIPQGWTGEYNGWTPERAWLRSLEIARLVETSGFTSAWVFDHFHTIPEPSLNLTFESFTMLAALAARTTSIRLGHVVICAGFRNPALVAKMAGTLDVAAGGRFMLGIGAGWKEDEWVGYGYKFPSVADRLAALRDDLEVITRMLDPNVERAYYDGRFARVDGAINEPKGGTGRRVPIMVGGNGPNVTWRLAARYADELNLDGLSPQEVDAALPIIRSRCEEIGRDPASLPVSVHIWTADARQPGRQRIERLAAYRDLGIIRVTCLLRDLAAADEPLVALAEDARAAGLSMSTPS